METNFSKAVLSSHKDTHYATREEIARIPNPVGTETFKPVPHIELISTLEKVLSYRSITIQQEQFAIRADGSRLFGTLDLSLNGGADGNHASIGLRTANDKSMAIQMVAGLRVFVCDNLVLRGDFIPLSRRHTSGLRLEDELVLAVNKFEEHYAVLKGDIEDLKSRSLSDSAAKAAIYDVFNTRKLPIRLLPEVGKTYFDLFKADNPEPKFNAFADRNAWSLHNAFTEVAKIMPLTTRMDAISVVGRYFGLTSKN